MCKHTERIEKHRECITKQYWEIQAGVSILCGAPEYICSGNFDPTLVPKSGKGGFDDIEFWIRFHRFFKIILEEIESQQIDFYGRPQHVQSLSEYLPSSFSKRLPLLQESKIQSRLVNAHQMIAAVISKGFDLPDELQAAANICISKASKVEGRVAENHVMADAIIHFQWWKEPESTMEEIDEELKKIVKSHKSLWVYKQKESARKQQKRLRPLKGKKPPEIVPGIIEDKCIHYQKLKITLETLGRVLFFHERIKSLEQLYSHPLIDCYLWDEFHREFAMYCLADIMLQFP